MILIPSNQLSDVLCCFQFEYKYINILVFTLSSALYSNYHPTSDILIRTLIFDTLLYIPQEPRGQALRHRWRLSCL